MLVFNDNQFPPYLTSKLSDNETVISWSNFSEKVYSYFNEKGYNFNHIAKTKIITIGNKMDMSYDFYIKPNMCAPEWKVNAMLN